MEKEKEREINPDTDALLGMSVPGSDEKTYEVIKAFKKVFNAKTKTEEGICIGKIGRCLHVYEKTISTAFMYGAARFFELYGINNIGTIFGEMRDNTEVQEEIKTLEKYTFSFFLVGDCLTGAYVVKHKAGLPIEKLTTGMPFEMPN